ncbi:hypothetical protein B0H13DRAFT_2355347 [Mycena leptocephala]|nr:hypothetical protein B0H13DRAFT_2355347 [Mycena leptocephala]
MAASTVLKIQELCDYIADFLHGSFTDLKSCALVSPSFTTAAQRHIFHDIIFEPKCLDIAHYRVVEILFYHTRLSASGPFVRRLRASIQTDVLNQFRDMHLPNLAEFFLNKNMNDRVMLPAILAAAEIIALPSIRRVGLLEVIVDNDRDFGLLFEKATPQLQNLRLSDAGVEYCRPTMPTDAVPRNIARKSLTTLHVRGMMMPWPSHRILCPSFPFEISALQDVDCTGLDEPSAAALLDHVRPTLRRLAIDAPSTDLRIQLARFPRLTRLRLAVETTRFESVFGALLPGNCLEHLQLVVCIVPEHDQNDSVLLSDDSRARCRRRRSLRFGHWS